MKENTTDSLTACLMFSEMSMRKIGGDFSFLSAYYHGSKALTQPNIPVHGRLAARQYRLFALFQNLEKFDRLISFAQAPIGGYKGNLNNEEFYDFLIMSDAYVVWNSDESSNLLNTIKRLVKQHEPNHPKYNRESIIKEGEKAHKALFNVVSMVCS